jgi:hypothetical protein
VLHLTLEVHQQPEQLGEGGRVEAARLAPRPRRDGDRVSHPRLRHAAREPELGAERFPRCAPGRARRQPPSHRAGRDPGERARADPTRGVARGAPPGIGEDEPGIRAPADEREDRGRLVARDAAVALRRGAVACDLRGDRRAQPEALGRDLGRELVQTVLDGRVEVPDGFEQAERNDRRDGGVRGGAGGTRQGWLPGL